MRELKKDPVKAVLFDLDGVLYVGDEIIEGASEAVSFTRERGLRLAGITTTQSKRMIDEKLAGFDIPIVKEEIYTPAALAVNIIADKSATLYVRDALLEDFHAVQIRDQHPDYIVMGDLGGDGYTPDLLHTIFNHVMQGSQVLALHKNRFWQKQDGLHLDIGPFVAAVEYASGKNAMILGKPSADFFFGVCAALNVSPIETLMIGDDIESDIGGARDAGLQTALVKTGKHRADFVNLSGIQPDHLLTSIDDLPELLTCI